MNPIKSNKSKTFNRRLIAIILSLVDKAAVLDRQFTENNGGKISSNKVGFSSLRLILD